MNPILPPGRGRSTVAAMAMATALSALLLGISGCSSEPEPKREYATPKSLCGIAVDAGTLAEFLPAGSSASTKETVHTATATRCAVSVDGKRIVYAAQEWWNDMTVLQFAQGLTQDNPEHRTDDGRFAYSGNQAFGKTENCRSSEHDDQVLYTAIQASGSEHEDAAAMKKLITAYTKEVERSPACR